MCLLEETVVRTANPFCICTYGVDLGKVIAMNLILLFISDSATMGFSATGGKS